MPFLTQHLCHLGLVRMGHILSTSFCPSSLSWGQRGVIAGRGAWPLDMLGRCSAAPNLFYFKDKKKKKIPQQNFRTHQLGQQWHTHGTAQYKTPVCSV